jgi:hypothetical protein
VARVDLEQRKVDFALVDVLERAAAAGPRAKGRPPAEPRAPARGRAAARAGPPRPRRGRGRASRRTR